jgi:hypothetical protein
MTDEEMREAYLNGMHVSVCNHDYKFTGHITIIFRKFKKGDVAIAGAATGPWRCVVQNGDGVCLIQSAKNLEIATQ